jgi:hypothetical protein
LCVIDPGGTIALTPPEVLAMADHDTGSPTWLDRIRRWLWLDRTQRTDDRNANRGFYPGGPPVYVDRKPLGWRFTLAVAAIAIAIGLVILSTREAEARGADGLVGSTWGAVIGWDVDARA